MRDHTPCDTGGRAWTGTTDARGRVTIPAANRDVSMSLTVAGYRGIGLPRHGGPGGRLELELERDRPRPGPSPAEEARNRIVGRWRNGAGEILRINPNRSFWWKASSAPEAPVLEGTWSHLEEHRYELRYPARARGTIPGVDAAGRVTVVWGGGALAAEGTDDPRARYRR